MKLKLNNLGALVGSMILSSMIGQSATTSIIDDFTGGPHIASLVSISPPEISTGTFFHPGAIGGVRDVFVISFDSGAYAAGVAFGSGGYASFSGKGIGAIVYDGVPGISDVNNDKSISLNEMDYGLSIDLTQGLPDAKLRISAFTDLPGASIGVVIANSPTEWARYDIQLTEVGQFADYFQSILLPTFSTLAYNPRNVGAVALYMDGLSRENVDIRVNGFEISVIPESGTWISLCGLLGICALSYRRYRLKTGF